MRSDFSFKSAPGRPGNTLYPALVQEFHVFANRNKSVQYDGGFLPDIIVLTQCYYHRGTRLNAMKRFCIFSY